MTASKGRSGSVVLGPDVRRTRARGRSRASAPVRPIRCTSAPAARANMRHEQADRARARGPAARSPGRRSAARDGAQRVAARLDQRAERGVDRVGQRRAATSTGTASCSASAPGRPPRMPTSCAVVADVLAPAHGSGGSAPQPSIVSPVTRRPIQRRVDAVADGATTVPHHSCPRRIGYARVPVVQVRHLAGEELDVGAAHADPLDVDDDLARRRRPAAARPGPRASGTGEDEGPHGAAPAVHGRQPSGTSMAPRR